MSDALREALAELCDLMDAVREGTYKPDSFTTQPARALLAAPEPAALSAPDEGRVVPDGYECPACGSVYHHTALCRAAPASPEPRRCGHTWGKHVCNQRLGHSDAHVKSIPGTGQIVAMWGDDPPLRAGSPEPEGGRGGKCACGFPAEIGEHTPVLCLKLGRGPVVAPAAPPSPAPRETSGEEAPAGDGWDGVRESVAKGKPSPSPAAPAAAKGGDK